jgi:hypothetical protein
MRKGEKLLGELWIRSKKYPNPYTSIIRESQEHENMLRYLSEISDEELERILKNDY